MTEAEACVVAAAALDVDSSCPACAADLLHDLERVFPEQADVWHEAHDANERRYDGDAVARFQGYAGFDGRAARAAARYAD